MGKYHNIYLSYFVDKNFGNCNYNFMKDIIYRLFLILTHKNFPIPGNYLYIQYLVTSFQELLELAYYMIKFLLWFLPTLQWLYDMLLIQYIMIKRNTFFLNMNIHHTYYVFRIMILFLGRRITSSKLFVYFVKLPFLTYFCN